MNTTTAHPVVVDGDRYVIYLPSHWQDENHDSVSYYERVLSIRIRRGLVSGDRGLLAGAYEWERVVS